MAAAVQAPVMLRAAPCGDDVVPPSRPGRPAPRPPRRLGLSPAAPPMTSLPLNVLKHPLPALCTVAPALRPRLGVRDRIDDPYGVALTFDDGPGPDGTPRILNALANLGVTATFFVTGEQVRDHPAIAAEVVAAGHEISVKADQHRNVLRVSPWTLRDDLNRAEDAIASATGVLPRLYRPPYGVLSAAALSLAADHG